MKTNLSYLSTVLVLSLVATFTACQENEKIVPAPKAVSTKSFEEQPIDLSQIQTYYCGSYYETFTTYKFYSDIEDPTNVLYAEVNGVVYRVWGWYNPTTRFINTVGDVNFYGVLDY